MFHRAFVCKFQKPGFVCCPISLRFFESRGWAKNAWCDSQHEHSRDHIASTSIGYLFVCLFHCAFSSSNTKVHGHQHRVLPFCWPSKWQTTKNKPKNIGLRFYTIGPSQIDLSLFNLTKCCVFLVAVCLYSLSMFWGMPTQKKTFPRRV